MNDFQYRVKFKDGREDEIVKAHNAEVNSNGDLAFMKIVPVPGEPDKGAVLKTRIVASGLWGDVQLQESLIEVPKRAPLRMV